jgi:DNA-binding transcriptional regulator YiaG
VSPAEVTAAREALGLTRRQLASRMEVTPRTVQMWEAGDRAIPGPARLALRLMAGTPLQYAAPAAAVS